MEINDKGGISGRTLTLRIVDAGGDPEETAALARNLAEAGQIDAVVGMHISAVRQSLVQSIGGQLPYIYTPLYEGGEMAPGVYAIGDTPADQLYPALDWLMHQYGVRRWVLIGNDYVWPRTTHRMTKQHFKGGARVVLGERYLPFGIKNYDSIIDWIRQLRPDAVMVSMVGQDAVAFNRAFGKAGLSKHILRFSCAIEENVLLGIGQENSDGLFAAASYFANMQTADNGRFKERYYALHGENAPVLNSIGQSLYEGIHFLSGLLDNHHGDHWRALHHPVRYGGARNSIFGRDRLNNAPVYLSEAQGNEFKIVERLSGD